MIHGKVIGIYIGEKARALPVAVASVGAVAGRGLKGNRYGK